jgi:hypothetical protein
LQATNVPDTSISLPDPATVDLGEKVYPGALKELEGLSSNIQYEQLDYLGLENSLDRLVATFHTKLPSGFSGTPARQEAQNTYFWSDWDDNCTRTLLGTVKVNMHDIPTIPTDGLAYAAVRLINLQSAPANNPRSPACVRASPGT